MQYAANNFLKDCGNGVHYFHVISVGPTLLEKWSAIFNKGFSLFWEQATLGPYSPAIWGPAFLFLREYGDPILGGPNFNMCPDPLTRAIRGCGVLSGFSCHRGHGSSLI